MGLSRLTIAVAENGFHITATHYGGRQREFVATTDDDAVEILAGLLHEDGKHVETEPEEPVAVEEPEGGEGSEPEEPVE